MTNITDLQGFLKYGFPGLVVIFAILLFLLFRTQYQKQLTNKDFLIRTIPFGIISGGLILFAYLSLYNDKKYSDLISNLNYQKRIDSLNTELLICNGRSPSTESNQNKFDKISNLKDSLEKQIKGLEKDIKTKDEYLSQTIMIRIASSFETIISHTQTKGSKLDQKFNHCVAKNAVFQNVLTFGADTAVLRKALSVLVKRGFIENIDISKIIAETPSLFNLRRNWLKKAILKLDNAVEALGPKQESASVEIELPKEVWILEKPYKVFIDEDNIIELHMEKELLDKITL